MNKEKVISEVNQIIWMLDENDRNKIPENMRSFFKKNSTTEESYKLDKNILLKEQNLSEETLDIITFLYSYVDGKYWSQLESQRVQNMFDNHELKEFNEQYNYDDLFKNRRTEIIVENTEEKALTIYEALPFYKRILIKIKAFFMRDNETNEKK